jgi:hypothetical protein
MPPLRLLAILALSGSAFAFSAFALDVSVTLPASLASKPLDGRLLLLFSTDPSAEPRFQISDSPKTQIVFGSDVDHFTPGTTHILSTEAYGYPIRRLAQLPPGEYYVQVLFDLYETFHRADGHTLKLPTDRGEGRQWNRAPGNLFSKPLKLRIQPGTSLQLTLTDTIPAITPPPDTPFIKHIRIQSDRLTKFWGRPMYLGAHILLPHGFDQHPEAKFPLMLFHGHFPANFEGFRPQPPDDTLKPDYAERFKLSGYNRIQQQEAHRFFQQWTAPNFPRFLIVQIQHANPFYDDSYAVNSANLGPYGDAIMYELLPAIEAQFRGIGQGWARFTYGGSTGGWEALAAQIFYPTEFNAAFGACPDPIDFRAHTTINIYEDKNAYFIQGPHQQLARPGKRDYLGHVSATIQSMNQMELALGSKTRSGQQFDIWEAVYSPTGPDGYPKRLWDKETGDIDPSVAAYWKEHFDLRHILTRDWAKLGPQLQGKLHIYCGDMDNFYLNNAVYLMEDFLKTTTYGGEVKYGDRFEHCWNGDPTLPNHISRLRYNTLYLDKALKRIEANHPPGADLKSWRY